MRGAHTSGRGSICDAMVLSTVKNRAAIPAGEVAAAAAYTPQKGVRLRIHPPLSPEDPRGAIPAGDVAPRGAPPRLQCAASAVGGIGQQDRRAFSQRGFAAGESYIYIYGTTAISGQRGVLLCLGSVERSGGGEVVAVLMVGRALRGGRGG